MFEFPSMSEIQKNQDRMRENGDRVRMLSDDGVTPEAGHYYTVTASFENGDQSWTECFWQVLSVCGPKCFVRIHQTHGDFVEKFWNIDSRSWFLADDAWHASKGGGE